MTDPPPVTVPSGNNNDSTGLVAGFVVALLLVIVIAALALVIVVFIMRKRQSKESHNRTAFTNPSYEDGKRHQLLSTCNYVYRCYLIDLYCFNAFLLSCVYLVIFEVCSLLFIACLFSSESLLFYHCFDF